MSFTRRFLRSFQDNLELGTLLALVAGVVNTIGFLQFGAFVSHMSGHATRVAVEYAEGNSSAALVFMLEVLAFIFGAFTTSFILRGHTAAESRVQYTVPVLLEALTILLYLLFSHRHGLYGLHLDHISLTTLLLAFSMGLQNAMLRHASGAIVRTTHITGVATDIGSELGAATYAAVAILRQGQALSAVSQAFRQRLGRGRFIFHCYLIFAFFLGALVGTVGFLYVMERILILPILILLFLAVKEHRRRAHR